MTIQGRNVSVRLPSPEILTWKLDNRTTRVLDRSRGVFRWVGDIDIDLEGEARQQAEYGILHAACEAEILPRASADAIKAVEDFIATVDVAEAFTFEIEVASLNTQRCNSVARLMMMFE